MMRIWEIGNTAGSSAVSWTARRHDDSDRPVHFGIIMAVSFSIGLYTPPFGLDLFASQAIFNQRLSSIYRGVSPLVAINFATPMVISDVPAIGLALAATRERQFGRTHAHG
jgi:TRAP-type mannitol/chloroaromatic compound transport system permease large subunit